MSAERIPDPERLRRIVLLVLALIISALFLWMIREFLVALLFAAILSGIFYPLSTRLSQRFGGRKGIAAGITTLLVFLLVVIPLLGFLGLVAAEAVQLAQSVRPWVVEHASTASELGKTLEQLPGYNLVSPYQEQILAKLGQYAGGFGSFAVGALTAAAKGTANFVFMLFVMLYAMFFFLIDGRSALKKILYYLPLPAEDESRMLDRFVSVTRATIKGTLVVGFVQGALAGLAFFAAGIEGAAFWATAMAVLSVIPGLGPAIVWLPAVAYLFAIGRWGTAIAVLAWCAGLVGTIDNLLRPRLVGKDTKMPDLLILLSTLGGIVLWGVAGIVIGPIVGALFVTIWDLYGAAYRDVLPGAGLLSVPPPPIDRE
jgi:predicted PurR-regulated permease PerM